MNQELIIPICISELISLILIIRLWLKKDYLVFKIVRTLLTLAPFVGPIFYTFTGNPIKRQPEELQNNIYRGGYTHKWITMRPFLEELIAGKKREIKGEDEST